MLADDNSKENNLLLLTKFWESEHSSIILFLQKSRIISFLFR